MLKDFCMFLIYPVKGIKRLNIEAYDKRIVFAVYYAVLLARQILLNTQNRIPDSIWMCVVNALITAVAGLWLCSFISQMVCWAINDMWIRTKSIMNAMMYVLVPSILIWIVFEVLRMAGLDSTSMLSAACVCRYAWSGVALWAIFAEKFKISNTKALATALALTALMFLSEV